MIEISAQNRRMRSITLKTVVNLLYGVLLFENFLNSCTNNSNPCQQFYTTWKCSTFEKHKQIITLIYLSITLTFSVILRHLSLGEVDIEGNNECSVHIVVLKVRHALVLLSDPGSWPRDLFPANFNLHSTRIIYMQHCTLCTRQQTATTQ